MINRAESIAIRLKADDVRNFVFPFWSPKLQLQPYNRTLAPPSLFLLLWNKEKCSWLVPQAIIFCFPSYVNVLEHLISSWYSDRTSKGEIEVPQMGEREVHLHDSDLKRDWYDKTWCRITLPAWQKVRKWASSNTNAAPLHESDKSTDSAGHTPASSSFDSRSPQSSVTSIAPPRAEEWDRTLRHTGLRDFGEALQNAANAVYPNDNKSRYSRVYVLLICWKTQDPKLPVEREIRELRRVFEEVYRYNTEEFEIPDSESHAAVSEKINSFVKVDSNSSGDLKIVYYAGHSRLSRTKELLWSK